MNDVTVKNNGFEYNKGENMAIGFVLINIAPTKEKEVYEALSRLDEVKELHPLFGEYDLLAKVEVRSFEELSDIVINKIRATNGVIGTKTLTGARF